MSAARALVVRLEQEARLDRLMRWKANMHENVNARMRWITQRPADIVGEVGVDPHPQAAAGRFFDELSALWAPEDLEEAREEHLPEVEAWMQEVRTEAEMPQLTVAALIAALKRNVGKAASVDTLRAEHLLRMPVVFFEGVVQLWGVCVARGVLPKPWLMVRVVGIPKVDSTTLRPLSVEATIFRAIMSSITADLSNWVAAWAPECLAGAMRGRCMDDLHEAFVTKLEAAGDGDFAGVKLDLKRAFDMTRCEYVDDIALKLGCPAELVRLWRFFDKEHRKFVEYGGWVHPQPICCKRGVPQGDPASPMRFCLLMAAWVAYMGRRAPEANYSVYLDDRLLYLGGVDVVRRLDAALQANTAFEQHYGLVDNADKRSFFASRPRTRRDLEQHAGRAVQCHVEMLGVKHLLNGKSAFMEVKKIVGEAERRAHRIHLGGGTLKIKAFLLKMLVLSMFSWAGAWMLLTRALTARLARAVEHAVLPGEIRGRNKFLLWKLLGAELHPGFQQMWAAVSHTLQRARRHFSVYGHCSAWKRGCITDAESTWSWTQHGRNFVTPFGTLTVGVDSAAAFRDVAKRSWHLKMQQDDPKFGIPALRGKEVLTTSHERFVRDDTAVVKRLWRTATGVPLDGVWRARLQRKLVEDFPCMCGQVPASAEHLTFDCTSRPPGTDLPEPALAVHAKYLTEHMDVSPAAVRVLDQRVIEEAVTSLRARLRGHRLLYLATDGGAITSAGPNGTSAWGCAATFGDGVTIKAGGVIGGLDVSAIFAEIWAMLHAAHVVARLAVEEVVFICDNMYVVEGLQGMAAESLLPKVAPAIWVKIKSLLAAPLRWKVTWCPSHGKHPKWQPVAPYAELEMLWRALNDAADKQCSVAMQAVTSATRAADVRREAAERWCLKALRLRYLMLSSYGDAMRSREARDD
jgi:ribonuclease HI